MMETDAIQKQDSYSEIEKAVIEHYNTTYKGVSNSKMGLELALRAHLIPIIPKAIARLYLKMRGKK